MKKRRIGEASSQWELEAAHFLWESLSRADMGHVVSLLDSGLLKHSVAAPLLRALVKLEKQYPSHLQLDAKHGDLYKNREAWLREAAPEEYGYLALARARREASTMALYLKVRSQLVELRLGLAGLIDVLIEKAAKNTDTIMPDYTYLQPAHPSTFAHYLLGFAFPLHRDLERLALAFAQVNRCPGGIGSTNGSGLPLDRDQLARIFGFSEPVTHARDAMWQHDVMLEIYSALSSLGLNIGRLSNDFHVWCTHEFDYVELPAATIRGSVIMPQKKNPYVLSYARGVSNLMFGRLAGAASLGATCTGQIDNRIFIYNELPESLQLMNEVLALLKELFAGVKLKKKRLAQRAEESFTQATDLAELIMHELSIGFSQAHDLMRGLSGSKSVREFEHKLFATLPDLPVARRRALSKRLQNLWSAKAVVATRRGLGGAAPESVKRMISGLRGSLRVQAAAARKDLRAIQMAEVKMDRRIQTLIKKKESV